MAEIASAFVTVAPSARGFGRSLDSQISPEMAAAGGSVGSKFGTALKVGALAVAGGAVLAGSFLKGAIGEAREAQKVAALTNAVIESTGGIANVTAAQVDKLATSISLKTGVDDEAIAAGQNMLLTFTNVRNEVGKGNDIFNQATVAAVDMAAAFGGDATSNSKILGKALNDPIAGVSALTRVGVSFTAQQKEQIKTLVESGNVLGAQKMILGELTTQTAGAAEAQATAGDKLKVAWDNFRESIGTALLPVVDQAMTALTGFVVVLTNDIGPGIAALNGYLQPVIASVGAFFSSFGSGGGGGNAALQGFVQSITTNFLPVLQQIGATLVNDVVPKVVAFGTYMRNTAGPMIAEYAHIISSQVVPIVASFARFVAGTLWPALMRISQQVGQNLRPAFEQLVATFRAQVLPAVQAALVKFREWQPTIQKAIAITVVIVGVLIDVQTTILGKVLPAIIRFIGFVGGNVVTAVKSAISVIVAVSSAVIDFGGKLVEAGRKAAEFAKAVKDKFSEALGVVRAIPGQVASALGDLGSVLYNAGQELIQGLINGILSKLGAVGDAMGSVASKVKGFLPGSPVKEGPLKSWNYGAAGERLIDLLTDGIKSATPKAVEAVQDLAQKVHDAMTERLDALKGTLSGLKDDFTSLASSVSQAFATNLFEATDFDAFRETAVSSIFGLQDMQAAFRKLRQMGATKGFLSDLFASGNTALISDLASGSRSDLQNAQAYARIQDRLLGDLGSQVARNEYGPRIDRISGQLQGVRADIQALAGQIGKELNGKAANAHRKARAAA